MWACCCLSCLLPNSVRRLSASKIQELTAVPESLPFTTLSDRPSFDLPPSASVAKSSDGQSTAERLQPAYLGLSLEIERAWNGIRGHKPLNGTLR